MRYCCITGGIWITFQISRSTGISIAVPCKRRSSANSRALMTLPESLKPIFCVEQWEPNGSKNKFIAKGDILHYGKRSLFWSLIIFPYLSFTTVWGQKNWFQQLWKYTFFKYRKLPYITDYMFAWSAYSVAMRKHFSFTFVPFVFFATQLFSTPVTSSKIRPDGAPSFTSNHL